MDQQMDIKNGTTGITNKRMDKMNKTMYNNKWNDTLNKDKKKLEQMEQQWRSTTGKGNNNNVSHEQKNEQQQLK